MRKSEREREGDFADMGDEESDKIGGDMSLQYDSAVGIFQLSLSISDHNPHCH